MLATYPFSRHSYFPKRFTADYNTCCEVEVRLHTGELWTHGDRTPYSQTAGYQAHNVFYLSIWDK